jgi:HPt (histidine-containing phosphotransfer) domain-containing protein
MLIYNFQKEFIGIDESDLKALGFSNLSQLRAESADFADLFVRTPGYIHNFKHVHWIDFITCADPSEESKVIIDVNSHTYTAKITISTLYLNDNPTSKAYLIHLNNLRTLTSDEVGDISDELAQKPVPVAAPIAPVVEVKQEPFVQDVQTIQEVPLQEETPYETIEESYSQDIPETSIPDMIEIDDFDLAHDIEEPTPITEPLNIPEEEPLDEDFDYDYKYDPQVASDELGLPIDLIEEFIQDFISQAQEFKSALYSSLDEADIDNVKILSHKLKGVAANLRIEDAFNTLSIINTSEDHTEIRNQLNIFYKIIAKLSGKEIQTVQTSLKETPIEAVAETKTQESDDLYDDLVIDFKEELEEEIKDTDVPDSINVPELADDDFVAEDEDLLNLSLDEEPFKDEDISLEDTLEISLQEIELPEETNAPEEIELPEEINTPEEIEIPEETEPFVEYSKTQVANEIGLDEETFEELFNDYIHESKTILQTLDSALTVEDNTKIKQEAIKLKGMSDNMRVHSFLDKLDILINTSDKTEMKNALESIRTIIQKISK